MSYWTKQRRVQSKIRQTVNNILNGQGGFNEYEEIGPPCSTQAEDAPQLEETVYVPPIETIPQDNVTIDETERDDLESLCEPMLSSDESGDEDGFGNICQSLSQWALQNNITHVALRELLTILRGRFKELPKDPRTLLSTGKVSPDAIKTIGSGYYYHFGVKYGLIKAITHKVINEDKNRGCDIYSAKCGWFASVEEHK